MKSTLLLVIGVACLIARALGVEWTEKAGLCFSCLNPHDTDPGSSVYFCLSQGNCQYDTFSNCDVFSRIGEPEQCIEYASSIVTESSACDIITNLTLNRTPQFNTIELGVNEYCYITLTGDSTKLRISYVGEGLTGAVYYPDMDSWNNSTFQASNTELDAAFMGIDEIKVILVNYDTSNQAVFTVMASDPDIPDPNNNCAGGSEEFWTGRDGKCFSCLNPHDTNPSNDPVYWCTNTETCEHSTYTCSGATRLSLPNSCIERAGKTEDPACAAVNSLNLTSIPQNTTVTLPADSFCYITLTGATTTLQIYYYGYGDSGAVYYPAQAIWNSSTLQAADTLLDAATLGETTELKVALVNYDPLFAMSFFVVAADSSVLSWTGSDDKCFSCLNPHDTNPTFRPVYYCFETGACEYEPCLLCPPAKRIANPLSCIQSANKTQDPACDYVNSLLLSEVPLSTLVTLPADSFCEVTLIGNRTTLNVTYADSGSKSAVYYPIDAWSTSTLLPSGIVLDAEALGETSGLKAALVNYHPSLAVTFIVEVADLSIPSPYN